MTNIEKKGVPIGHNNTTTDNLDTRNTLNSKYS